MQHELPGFTLRFTEKGKSYAIIRGAYCVDTLWPWMDWNHYTLERETRYFSERKSKPNERTAYTIATTTALAEKLQAQRTINSHENDGLKSTGKRTTGMDTKSKRGSVKTRA